MQTNDPGSEISAPDALTGAHSSSWLVATTPQAADAFGVLALCILLTVSAAETRASKRRRISTPSISGTDSAPEVLVIGRHAQVQPHVLLEKFLRQGRRIQFVGGRIGSERFDARPCGGRVGRAWAGTSQQKLCSLATQVPRRDWPASCSAKRQRSAPV